MPNKFHNKEKKIEKVCRLRPQPSNQTSEENNILFISLVNYFWNKRGDESKVLKIKEETTILFLEMKSCNQVAGGKVNRFMPQQATSAMAG